MGSLGQISGLGRALRLLLVLGRLWRRILLLQLVGRLRLLFVFLLDRNFSELLALLALKHLAFDILLFVFDNLSVDQFDHLRQNLLLHPSFYLDLHLVL